MTLEIEDNVPIPPKPRDKGYTLVLDLLEVGQSVVIPAGKNVALVLARKRLGAGNFTSRKVDKGYRIWRLR